MQEELELEMMEYPLEGKESLLHSHYNLETELYKSGRSKNTSIHITRKVRSDILSME